MDIYPSLCDMAGLAKPDHLAGQSFVPLLRQPDRPWKKAVFSRYMNGESIRTERYLYSEWHDRQGEFYGRMLYDHRVDPRENVNISELPENQDLVKKLAHQLRRQVGRL